MTARLLPTLSLSLLVALSACGRAEESVPLEPETPAFDVTTEALVTNTIQFRVRCANGVSGRGYYGIGVEFWRIDCPGGSRTFSAAGAPLVHLGFEQLAPTPVSNCGDTSTTGDADGLPYRYTCTVNGPNWTGGNNPGYHGKPLAKIEVRFVQDP